MHKENYNLKGKRAFITGGGRGIGFALQMHSQKLEQIIGKQMQTDSPILMGLA